MDDHNQEQEESLKIQNEKSQQYIQDLLNERLQLSKLGKFPHCERMLDAEIQAAKQSSKPFRDNRYIDVYREKQIRIIEKVSIPIKDYPKFNFVGKLLGPSGNSFRRLQEETMCKMAILGRGSMRDKEKEEEYRNSLDPKYAHLHEDLHVEVSALGPPAEAHARIAFALAEIRKFLVPDANDTIRQEQFKEIMSGEAGQEAAEKLKSRIPPYKKHAVEPRQVMPAKAKIMSILDRARVSLEESYGYEETSYPPTPSYHQPHHSYEQYPTESYYEPRSSKYAIEYSSSHGHSHSHSHSHPAESYHPRSESYGHSAPSAPSWKSYSKSGPSSHAHSHSYSSHHYSGKRSERHAPYSKPSR